MRVRCIDGQTTKNEQIYRDSFSRAMINKSRRPEEPPNVADGANQLAIMSLRESMGEFIK
jgi:hypothetical protein